MAHLDHTQELVCVREVKDDQGNTTQMIGKMNVRMIDEDGNLVGRFEYEYDFISFFNPGKLNQLENGFDEMEQLVAAWDDPVVNPL